MRHVDPFIGTDDGDAPDPPPGDTGGAVFPGATAAIRARPTTSFARSFVADAQQCVLAK